MAVFHIFFLPLHLKKNEGTMKKALLLLMLLLLSLALKAQMLTDAVSRARLNGRVTDALTGEPVKGATVSLLAAADSTVLQTTVISNDSLGLGRLMPGLFTLNVEEKGHYLIKVSHLGYQTSYTPLTKKYKREDLSSTLLQIRLKREARMLDEVNVTGTRIKMVLRGDTVVYNADAFNLAEGSMLDALIRQLPGAELSRDGEIKVNGRHVDHLLVDGRDFFTGDPKAALANLPAYTVNKIKVFDRTGHRTRLMGRDMGDRSYVMDVRLKKQYSTGLMGNVEAGGGTDDRYRLKGMATRSRGRARLSLAANLNNLNDNLVGNDVVSSTSPSASTGVKTTRKAQIGYNTGDFNDPVSLGLNVGAFHDSDRSDMWTSAQTYLTGGDTYSRQAAFNRSRSKGVSASSEFNFLPKGMVIGGTANVSYSHDNTQGRQMQAAFDADPAAYGDLLNDLFQNPGRYRQLTLYRQQQMSRSEAGTVSAAIMATGSLKVMADMVTLMGSVNYSHIGTDNYQQTDLDYMKRQGQHDFRWQYTDAPTSSFNGSIGAQYDLAMGRQNNLHVEYTYRYDHSQNDNSLYRLDRLAGLDSTVIDLLPSTAEALSSVLDATNSYNATRNDHTQQLMLQLRLKPRFLGNGSIEIGLPTEWIHKSYDYFRETQQHLTQSDLTVNPTVKLLFESKTKQPTAGGLLPYKVSGNVGASLQTLVPDITQMVVYRDDSDPLNVRLSGGSDLKHTRSLNLSAGASLMGGRQMRTVNLSFSYIRTYDAIATSMVYDKLTGQTTTRPVNVDGNWQFSVNLHYGQSFGQKKQWTLRNFLRGGCRRSVDLNQVAGTEQNKNTVSSTGLTDELRLSWRFGKGNELALNGSTAWTRMTGSRDDFHAINTGNLSLGASALLQLPWKLQLNTSLADYSRHGYSDPAMNTNELIWSATLSRPLLKNKLSVAVEGFDLLGQLSNRQYAVNAQGRTERYTNILSQYVLLKLTWRFNKFSKPKT